VGRAARAAPDGYTLSIGGFNSRVVNGAVYALAYPWYAFWVPAGAPKPVVAKLNAAVVDALADATVRARLADLGQEIFPRDRQTPEALGAFHKAEIEKWWSIIRRPVLRLSNDASCIS
jgi:tripartite-type tricarboxylate transporter receptor subunit TctC